MSVNIPRCQCGVPRTDPAPPGCPWIHGALLPDSDRAKARREALMRRTEDEQRPLERPPPRHQQHASPSLPCPWRSP